MHTYAIRGYKRGDCLASFPAMITYQISVYITKNVSNVCEYKKKV